MKTKVRPRTSMTSIHNNDVFELLGFSKFEAEKLAIKSALMIHIDNYIKAHQLTQEEAAKLMHVARSRISDVVTGKIDKFTIDALVDMLSRIGFSVSCITKEKHAA